MKTKTETWVNRATLLVFLLFSIIMFIGSCDSYPRICYDHPPTGLFDSTWMCEDDDSCCQAWTCLNMQLMVNDADFLCECIDNKTCSLCAHACVTNAYDWSCFECEDGTSCWPCFDGACARN